MKEEKMTNYNEEYDYDYEDYENEDQYGYTECIQKVKEEIKQAIKEVKADEEKCPFGMRHKLINENYKKEIAKRTSVTAGNSAVKEILIRIGQGVFHITGEMYYHILKLRYIKDGSLPKFIFGNRQLITTIVAGTFILSHVNIVKDNNEEITNEPIDGKAATSQSENTERPELMIGTETLLMRKHLVHVNDTFYSLAWNAGITVEELEKINNYSDNNLLYGTIVNVPYKVAEKDLKHYIKMASVDNKSIKELADEYETDIETLLRLNSEAIEKQNGTYNILSSTITVPNFITRKELNEKRAEEYKNSKKIKNK